MTFSAKLGIWILRLYGVALLTLVIAHLLAGCASKQSGYNVRYVKGCSIDVTAASNETADEILDDVNLKDCELSGEKSLKGGEVPPKKN